MATFSQVLNAIVTPITIQVIYLVLRPLLITKRPDRPAIRDIEFSAIDTNINTQVFVTAKKAIQRLFRALVDNLPELRIILPNLQHLVQHIGVFDIYNLTIYHLTIDFSILTLVALRAQNYQKIIQKIIQTISQRFYFLLIFRFNFLRFATPHSACREF